MKFKRSSYSYVLPVSLLSSALFQIASAEGLFFIILFLILTLSGATLIWLILHPYPIQIIEDTVIIFKDYFRKKEIQIVNISEIRESNSSFMHAEIILKNDEKPVKISKWTVQINSFNDLTTAIK